MNGFTILFKVSLNALCYVTWRPRCPTPTEVQTDVKVEIVMEEKFKHKLHVSPYIWLVVMTREIKITNQMAWKWAEIWSFYLNFPSLSLNVLYKYHWFYTLKLKIQQPKKINAQPFAIQCNAGMLEASTHWKGKMALFTSSMPGP